ncbi:MAG: threonine--tRNA ligase [candidate division SR1 bacterium]|nr:threonine--tRNA ligase [candidate division SR1 bacterium]
MEDGLYRKRHSLSHILAQAMQREQQRDVEVAIGPAIDNGFYHDFLFSQDKQLKEEDLKRIQSQMEKIIKENQDFVGFALPDAESQKLVLDLMKQQYKEEMRSEFAAAGEEITFWANTIVESAKDALLKGINADYIAYYQSVTDYLQARFPDQFAGKFVTFLDMCEGRHVSSTKEIDPRAFKLEKLAGAYWRGNSDNVMMTRVYGLAFDTKEELQSYITMMEEAKKRDHRILGQKLKLFTISPLVGSGLPLLQPHGMIIRKEIEDFLWQLHKDKGYQRVWTPHLAKEDLYKTSGHAEKFGDELFRVKGKEENFFMKPMNCPHHMQIFADNQFSYRDMPVRYFEPATVYRDEKTGQLSGLTRVRSITQDDGHLFCRVDQIMQEVGTIVEIIKKFYSTLGMINDYWVRLSVRGPEGKYLGSDEVWEKAEGALRAACEKFDLPFKIGIDEAAFYGPKLDFMFKDAIGRERQLATIQCDFNLPVRFDLSFTNEQGEKERPVVIHRAISGSLERFMGVMIEHFGGAFPLWLAPIQVQIVPVAEKFNDYAFQLKSQLNQLDIRAKVDDGSDSFSKKIRNAELMKIPYTLIIGEKEQNSDSVSVREFRSKAQYEKSVEDFIAQLTAERDERKLSSDAQ